MPREGITRVGGGSVSSSRRDRDRSLPIWQVDAGDAACQIHIRTFWPNWGSCHIAVQGCPLEVTRTEKTCSIATHIRLCGFTGMVSLDFAFINCALGSDTRT